MNVVVNGEPVRLEPGATVADVLAGRGPHGLAVAVNGEVVPRDQHRIHALDDGDRVEVVTAVQGG